MHEIIQAIHELYTKIAKKHKDQIHLDSVLSEKEGFLSNKDKTLEIREAVVLEREGKCAVIENIKAAQIKNQEETQKISDERNQFEECKAAHSEQMKLENQDIEIKHDKIQKEFVAIKETKAGMEREISRRVVEMLEKTKKEKKA